ncbi:MAG: hypothetical protein E6Z65_07930 [Finegoldia magna]|uniref:hypothetical protein n=1 Tax=Finegoldia magna TaxID=1260 RepID=UPI0011D0EA11|nr:hypothetical protein [Finegoldia magna]MDU5809105.1 hypothetical protein [Finegoldia magna]
MSTVVLPITLPSLSLTTISAPGFPVPVILSSPSVGCFTVGASDCSLSLTITGTSFSSDDPSG